MKVWAHVILKLSCNLYRPSKKLRKLKKKDTKRKPAETESNQQEAQAQEPVQNEAQAPVRRVRRKQS